MFKCIKMSILFFAVIITTQIKAQVYNPVSYALNAVPLNGVKIVTNLPYTNSSQMPTIILEGYNYVEAKPILLTLVYYIFEGQFIQASVSSASSYRPPIKLANENGKVVIFIDDKKYFNRFTIRVFVQGMGEASSWFTGWTVKDEALGGTNVLSVPYDVASKLQVCTPTNSSSMTLGSSSGVAFSIEKGSEGYGLYSGISGNGDTWLQAGRTNSAVAYNMLLQASGGNVGIGTTSPQLWFDGTVTEINAKRPVLKLNSNNELSTIQFTQKDVNSSSHAGEFHLNYHFNKTDNTLSTISFDSYPQQNVLTMNSNGNVGIGTTALGKYKLNVWGTVRAHEIVVNSDGADFVFQPDYKLRPLAEVDSFIQQNKHLPEIKSASEMQADGMSVSELNTKLLQKVEELTLYIIEQNKKNEVLSKRVDELEKIVKK